MENAIDNISDEEFETQKIDESKTQDEINESQQSNASEELIKDELETKSTSDGWDDILGSGSLLKKTIKVGEENTRPQRLDICTINYKCTLEDGTEVESVNGFQMQLSDMDIIQGIDLSVALMNVGEICQLQISGRLAFGSQGLDNRVPPNATVLYEVELVKAEIEEDVANLTIAQRKQKGDAKRKRGNWWYGRGECTFAIQCYRRALDYLDEVEGATTNPEKDDDDPKQRELTDAALQDLMEDRISVSNNMAAAQMKLGAFDAALQSLQLVLRCQPNNVKALFRKAKVLKAKNEVQEALKCLQKAKNLQPENMTIQKEIQEINSLLKRHKTYEKELARRMFNGLTSPKDQPKADGSKSKKGFKWTPIVISVAVAIAGAVALRFKFS